MKVCHYMVSLVHRRVVQFGRSIYWKAVPVRVSVPYGQSNIATSIMFKLYILVSFKHVNFYNFNFNMNFTNVKV